MKIRFILFALALIAFVSCQQKNKNYYINDGFIQGTTYHIVYEYDENLGEQIFAELNRFDTSLSVYIDESTISKVNRNLIDSTADTLFLSCLRRSLEISRITGGAMDITVSPLVNVWGFGFDKREHVTQQMIDSLKEFCGYDKIAVVGNKIIKKDSRVQLNANAIAQGQSTDVICEMFERLAISNYMVEVGGEVRAKGLNPKGNNWRIGIDKPIDDSVAQSRELQDIVMLDNQGLATSGNYRKFYIENGMKYSHTIDPATGYPAQNGMLSASVIAPDCITADALATACMVVGVEKATDMLDTIPNVGYYLIYSDTLGEMQIKISDNFKSIIIN